MKSEIAFRHLQVLHFLRHSSVFSRYTFAVLFGELSAPRKWFRFLDFLDKQSEQVFFLSEKAEVLSCFLHDEQYLLLLRALRTSCTL